MKTLKMKLLALRGVLFFAFVIAGLVFAVKVSHDERVKQEQIAVEKAICELIEEVR